MARCEPETLEEKYTKFCSLSVISFWARRGWLSAPPPSGNRPGSEVCWSARTCLSLSSAVGPRSSTSGTRRRCQSSGRTDGGNGASLKGPRRGCCGEARYRCRTRSRRRLRHAYPELHTSRGKSKEQNPRRELLPQFLFLPRFHHPLLLRKHLPFPLPLTVVVPGGLWSRLCCSPVRPVP